MSWVDVPKSHSLQKRKHHRGELRIINLLQNLEINLFEKSLFQAANGSTQAKFGTINI
jgi:hypothetical protein